MEVETALEVLAKLTTPQQSTFERLVAQDGRSCDLNGQYVRSLADKDLLAVVIDELTQGVRLCDTGCGHAWYDIAEPVRAAYTQWAAQWQEADQPEDHPPPRVPDDEHPSVRALIVAERRQPERTQAPLYWARMMNPLYGAVNFYGTWYDQGQLLTLPGQWGDERLINIGYVEKAPLEKAYLHAQCGVCGAWFLNEHFRDAHGRERHRGRFEEHGGLEVAAGMMGPDGGAALRDITGDAASSRQWVEYPPYLEKTRASQQA